MEHHRRNLLTPPPVRRLKDLTAAPVKRDTLWWERRQDDFYVTLHPPMKALQISESITEGNDEGVDLNFGVEESYARISTRRPEVGYSHRR